MQRRVLQRGGEIAEGAADFAFAQIDDSWREVHLRRQYALHIGDNRAYGFVFGGMNTDDFLGGQMGERRDC